MISDSWWEVRLRISTGRWVSWAGPFKDDEEAQQFVDSLTLYGREVAIVRCDLWVKAVL